MLINSAITNTKNSVVWVMCGGGKQCEVCGGAAAEYRCPRCRLQYCSVACYKSHQSEPCQPAKAPHSQVVEDTQDQAKPHLILFPTDDTVPSLTLDKLRECDKLKELLDNRHLRELLCEVDRATNAQTAMQRAMLEPIFTEFADTVLTVVEPDMEAAAAPPGRKQESL